MEINDTQGRAAAALEIKKALRRGPAGTMLAKHVKAESARLRKNSFRRLADQVSSAMVKVGLLPARDQLSGVGDCSLNEIRKVHDDGPQFETPDQEWLRKVASPPQSWNARNDNTMADTGGTQQPARQQVPDAKPTRLGPAHSESVSPRQALPTDAEDPTVAALKSIYARGPQRGP